MGCGWQGNWPTLRSSKRSQNLTSSSKKATASGTSLKYVCPAVAHGCRRGRSDPSTRAPKVTMVPARVQYVYMRPNYPARYERVNFLVYPDKSAIHLLADSSSLFEEKVF
ncbi:hypothetical protein AVEN_213128-1 [Araneus ventricosus]|uniref:Uncharacterized protein n=1 Tax=Araneus ventricosus TaxID=182803 RepID=A0A4Y2N3B0_ARAVE|nr:hypothetical protein AVEN_213128-1 [Araneus ventricosus]